MGTGMAFPWDVIRSSNLASGEIVEDLKLGLDLTLAGKSPRFCPSASVHSVFPSSEESSRTQRQRWEKGHIATIVSAAPRLLIQAAARRNLDLLVLTLDMMIPPLSLLGLLLIGSTAIAGIIAIAGGSAVALFLSLANMAVFALAILLTWTRFGRDVLPTKALSSMAYYVFRKLPLYNRILMGKSATKWVRTDRGPSQRGKD
jgi:cellulose synthase/poly-beta-1,6-N-acetylglucosamine synthase-like glycosyltransferase